MSYCHMFFGPPGSGKTTVAVKIAQKYISQNVKVFTNFPCKGAYQLDTTNLGTFEYRDAVLLIDEAGIDFNNRNWKSFSQKTTEYVKLHRHYNTTLIFFSQGWDDCDKKIRTICTRYFYLKKVGPFTLAREVCKKVGIDEMTKQIIDEYAKRSALFAHGVRITYRPKYYKYFDSWEAPQLPAPPLVRWDAEEAPAD